MKISKYLFPAATLLVGVTLNTLPSHAKPEYTKKEKKACTVCHVKMGKKDLNDAGRCYEKSQKMAECLN